MKSMANRLALFSPHHSSRLLFSLSNSRSLVPIDRPLRSLHISTSACRNWVSVAQLMQSPGGGSGGGSRKGVARATNNIGPVGSGGGGFPLPNVPIWARWVLGAIALLVMPFYKKVLRIEDEVQKDAEIVAEIVEKVAEVTEKIAGDVADAIPGNGKIKQAILEIEHIADEVDKGAEQAEAILNKVDEIKEEVETMIETADEKPDLMEKAIPVKEDPSQSTN